jgi:hypothetical protein
VHCRACTAGMRAAPESCLFRRQALGMRIRDAALSVSDPFLRRRCVMTAWSIAPRRAIVLLLLVAVLLLVAPITHANTRTVDGGDLPYYARIERWEEPYHNDEWAAIVFYRPPGCVPDSFDLLDFYDFPDGSDLGAFECTPPTTDGFIVWDGAPGESDPVQIKLHGLGDVPVWFVAWPELEDALGDEHLYMTELAGMPSLLTGSASFYNETLHPTGGMIVYVAHGVLEDGRDFRLNVTLISGVMKVRIDFE